MIFFYLCLFILSSFFAIAETPVPEQDRQYLQQEEDENGYGCVSWSTVSIGETWVGRHPQLCDEYCRPPRSGDNQIIVLCDIVDSPQLSDPANETYFLGDSCLGVADNEKEAKIEASAICTYKIIQYCNKNNCISGTINTEDFISCKHAKVCFGVDYDVDDRPLIDSYYEHF